MGIADEPRRSRGRVAVVDDDAPHRRLMAMRLEEDGFETTTFASGEECLASAGSFGPEVILLDINMPGLDGIETCRRLKKDPELQNVPVLFVTGQSDDDPTTVEALQAGGNDFISKDASQPVLVARVACQITIQRAQSKLREAAITDELTGAFSRRFLFDALRRAVKSSSRVKPRGVSCLIADLDNFKRLNDTLGHLKGDEALKQVADTIRANTRETDVVGRFGGEEFVIVLPDTPVEDAVLVAEKIRCGVERDCKTTLSIGVAYTAPTAIEALRKESALDGLVQQLLHHADIAMYASKRSGRNRVTTYDPKLAE